MTVASIHQALQTAQQTGLARLDAQWLLLHVLGRPSSDRGWLLAHDDQPLTDLQALAYEALIHRRASGEPLAYLVGYKEFFGLELHVDTRVLVPRPDTETLVTWALEVISTLMCPADHVLKLVDLGTGSGAVALALAQALSVQGRQADVLAVDASADALQVAVANAQRLGLAINVMRSDWLDNVGGHFHLMVSNPPYVAFDDPHLAALRHEPLSALASGPDGLDDIRAIIAQAPVHLLPGGWLLLEHGYDQASAVHALLQQAGFTDIGSRADLAGIARCSGGRWPAPIGRIIATSAPAA